MPAGVRTGSRGSRDRREEGPAAKRTTQMGIQALPLRAARRVEWRAPSMMTARMLTAKASKPQSREAKVGY